MAIRITLECGHTSVLRPRTTPEGYTHDWEVFVRGVDNADISQYIEKVVFQLHETFPKPKRVLKDAPYVLKESGYAGFVLPIYIYLKNKDEPKKIEISYDLTLQPSGPAINNVVRHSEIIGNPPDDFRRKLLKGGGIPVSTSNEPHDKSDQKLPVQMVGKPKLSGSDTKKHRPMDPRSTNQFAHLFGVPIKTTSKVSPESKKPLQTPPSHKPAPEIPSKPQKLKHSPYKDPKPPKTDDKAPKKDPPKEKERSKEKQKIPQTPPPQPPKRSQSPSKKFPTPPDPTPQKSSSPKIPKEHKKLPDREKHPEKPKDPLKLPEDPKTDKKKKKHKEDKESEKKERNRSKNSEKSKEAKPSDPKKSDKHEKPEKLDKEKVQENRLQKDIKRSPKPPKEGERSSSRSRPEVDKPKEQKVEKERPKHKHRKKDKKERSDDSREREKREKKEKKIYDKDGGKESVINPLSTLLAEVDRDSSDSVNSGDDEEAVKTVSKNEGLVGDGRLRQVSSPSSSGKVKDKGKREKSKPKADERDRKRKRRSGSKGDDEAPTKRDKDPTSPPLEPVSSSQSPAADVTGYNCVKEDSRGKEAFETEQIAPDSTNNMLVESEDEPLVFSEDYVSQLKELQQKIMTLQDNQELQRVVQVIAATGQYEITRKTFDFDLCTLDRRTVQRLQDFFSGS